MGSAGSYGNQPEPGSPSPSGQTASERHQRMIEALSAIRRAFIRTARLDPGPGYSLEVAISDWEGWPRVDLFLTDRETKTESPLYSLTASASDYNSDGLVQLTLKDGQCVGRLLMSNPLEISRVQSVIRHATTAFLAAMAPLVLSPSLAAQISVSRGQASSTELGAHVGLPEKTRVSTLTLREK